MAEATDNRNGLVFKCPTEGCDAHPEQLMTRSDWKSGLDRDDLRFFCGWCGQFWNATPTEKNAVAEYLRQTA